MEITEAPTETFKTIIECDLGHPEFGPEDIIEFEGGTFTVPTDDGEADEDAFTAAIEAIIADAISDARCGHIASPVVRVRVEDAEGCFVEAFDA
jgi:hypothetical protein